MKNFLLVLSVILVIFLMGCAKNNENTDMSEKTNKQPQQLIVEEQTRNHPYSNEQLIEMIKKYRTVRGEYVPEFIEVAEENGDIVTFHLYDMMDDHAVTSDWYYINRTTGKGSNLLEEAVNLNDANM